MNEELNIPDERFFSAIHKIRGQKVMLDADLAELYQIENRALKQAVRRNMDRFPGDFMFQLTKSEWKELITNCDNLPHSFKFSPVTPFAFTEQGVAMLSSVLNSKRAIAINIHIMRVFVKMRELAANYTELLDKIDELRQADAQQNQAISEIHRVINELLAPQYGERKPIGYRK